MSIYAMSELVTATSETTAPKLTPVLVQLLKGVLYRDTHEALWQALVRLETQVRDYVAVLGLALWLDTNEGFAFLKQAASDDETADAPRLIARRPLSYPVSLLCVLLRKRLLEDDARGDEVRAVVRRDDLRNAMQVFLKSQANEARQIDIIDNAIKKVVDLGFLRELKEPHHYEIRRIVKSLVDTDWLVDLSEKLEVYRRHAD